jgi:hypothetical protein
MDKEQLLLLFVVTIIVIGVTQTDAVEYFQTKSNMGNLSTRIHSYVLYGDDGTLNVIKSGNPLEVYVKYRTSIKSWNNANFNNIVDYCNFTVTYLPLYANATIVFNQIYTSDYGEAKYFIRLNKGEAFETDMICKFNQNQPATLELPADFSIVSTSWECKACQFYNWKLTDRQITKAGNLQTKTSTVMFYIQKLFSLNFEILVFSFWVLLILIFLLGIGLIFSGVYWLFKWLMKVIQ